MTAPEIKSASVIARSESPLATEVQGEVVLMSLERGQYFGLDDIASDVWRRLESPSTVDSLCSELAAQYSADRATIERDVLALLVQMREYGLITAA